MKAWLQANIPALYVRYTTVMRYKAMAKKLRQVVGLADPVPAEAVLAPQAETAQTEPPNGGGEGKRDHGAYEIPSRNAGRRDGVAGDAPVPELAVVRARAVWLEGVAGVGGNPTALMERLDALTDPERVEDANMLAGWRAKYGNEITERMKSFDWRVRRRSRMRSRNPLEMAAGGNARGILDGVNYADAPRNCARWSSSDGRGHVPPRWRLSMRR